MTRTLTALYQTREQAERVRDQLVAAHLGDQISISDQAAAESGGHRDIVEWIGGLFGGHDDRHLYAEGLRRGHVLLTVKVDDLNETRAAGLLDAAGPIDLDHAETSWRPENWTPRPIPVSTWSGAKRAEQGVPDAEPPPATRDGYRGDASPEQTRLGSFRMLRVRIYALQD